MLLTKQLIIDVIYYIIKKVKIKLYFYVIQGHGLLVKQPNLAL